jgi:hypothetical protein
MEVTEVTLYFQQLRQQVVVVVLIRLELQETVVLVAAAQKTWLVEQELLDKVLREA